MPCEMDECVFNFDLDFLQQHQPTASVEQPSKDEKVGTRRKALINVKKRIIPTSALVYRFKELKNVLEVTAKNLVASKEESKEMCIDYKNVLEKCSNLENERLHLQARNQELETKTEYAETCVAAMHSHVKQLQVLVKELETQVEALKVESRKDKDSARECERNKLIVEKCYETIKQEISLIANVILKNDKLTKEHKSILKKYRSSLEHERRSSVEKKDLVEDSENSDKEELEEVSSSDCKSNLVVTTQEHLREPVVNNLKIKDKASSSPDDGYSDCSNEVVSEDTGRGSSLANSAFQSPEHFSEDSPLNFSTNCDKNKINIISSQTISSSKSSINLAISKSELVTKVEKVYVTRSTSPSFKVPAIVVDLASEEVENNENDLLEDNRNDFFEGVDDTYYEDDNNDTFEDTNVAELLEKSSQQLTTDESLNIDCEVQMILKQMTLQRDLITPFPSSPTRSTSSRSSNIQRIDQSELINDRTSVQVQIADLQSKFESLETQHNTLNSKYDNVLSQLEGSNLKHDRLEKDFQAFKTQHNTLNSKYDNVLSQLEGSNLKHDRLEKDFQAFKTLMLRHIIMGSVGQFSINHTDTFVGEENIESPNYVNIEEHHQEGKFSHPVQICDDPQIDLSYNIVETQSNNNDHNEKQIFCEDNTQTDELMTMEDLYPENNNVSENLLSDSDETVVLMIADQGHEESANAVNNEKATNIESNKVAVIDNIVNDHSNTIFSENRLQEDSNDAEDDVICIRSPLRKRLVFEETEEIEIAPLDATTSESAANHSVDSHYEKEDKVVKRSIRAKRLSKLEKLRERVLRKKNKIRSEQPPPRKRLSRKVKHIPIDKEKSSKHTLDSSQLNDKNIYENAIKVMTDIRAKEEEKSKRQTFIKPRRKLRSNAKSTSEPPNSQAVEDQHQHTSIDKDNSNTSKSETPQRSRKRPSIERIENVPPNKRVLRSSVNRKSLPSESNSEHKDSKKLVKPSDNKKCPNATNEKKGSSKVDKSRINSGTPLDNNIKDQIGYTSNVSDRPLNEYYDMDLFKDESICAEIVNNAGNNVIDVKNVKYDNKCKEKTKKKKTPIDESETSVLKMGLRTFARYRRKQAKKVSNIVIGRIQKQIEDGIKDIVELGNETSQDKTRQEMDKFVSAIQKMNMKHFISGLMQYLKNPERKVELFSKASVFRAPPMTKAQQVLLYVIDRLKSQWEDVVDNILSAIEYELFQLNNSPEFDQIETMSHFYAVLCRYVDARSRLRLFVLDAMYCLQFKALPLIKQCIDVWMHIIPFAHSAMAKKPLNQCLVYLLHFYKCDDRFNRASDIRFLLSKRYHYQFSDWSEERIMQMLRDAIRDHRASEVDRKMVRLAIILVGKRRGAAWCHHHIVKRLILPILEDASAPVCVRALCADLIGPLVRPYPAHMRVDIEVAVNRLFSVLDTEPGRPVEEAVYRSLMVVSRQCWARVARALLGWCPPYAHHLSPSTRRALKDLVRERPPNVWRRDLARLARDID